MRGKLALLSVICVGLGICCLLWRGEDPKPVPLDGSSRRVKFLRRLSHLSAYGACLSTELSTATLPPVENASMAHSFKSIREIFVVHYSKSTARYHYIADMLAQFNLSARFVKQFDREELDNMTSCMEQNYTISLRPSEISLTVKHLAIYYLMVVHKIKNALVLEDDAFVYSTHKHVFKDAMHSLLRETPRPYDMMFPGTCLFRKCLKRPLCKARTSRCAHGYVVTLRGALKVLDHLGDRHADLPIDHIMNHANLAMYWSNPPLIGQSTEVEHVKN